VRTHRRGHSGVGTTSALKDNGIAHLLWKGRRLVRKLRQLRSVIEITLGPSVRLIGERRSVTDQQTHAGEHGGFRFGVCNLG
jgi:hypothetical protein